MHADMFEEIYAILDACHDDVESEGGGGGGGGGAPEFWGIEKQYGTLTVHNH